MIAQRATTSGQAFIERSFTFSATAGSHVLTYRVAPTQGPGDNTAFFDAVKIVPTGGSPTQAFTDAMNAAGLSGPAAALDATPHNDGVENLLKYAFNMNASGPDSRTMAPGGSGGLPGIAAQPNGASSIFRYEFLRRRDSGLIYTPQKSAVLDDPMSWTPLTDTPTVTPIDATWERVIYEEPYNSATTPRCFGRVQVTLPP